MKTKKTYSICTIFMMLAGLLLFTAQGVWASSPVNFKSYADMITALTAPGSTAVMFDVRSVEEHNGCQPPWWGDSCPDTSGTPAGVAYGTPAWTVDGVTKVAINTPFWISGNSGTVPEDPVELKSIIEGLLAAGTITFDTEIYLLCRSAVRSHRMIHWMDGEVFDDGTGTTGTFTSLYDVDEDGDEGGGGMQYTWNPNNGPIYQDLGLGDDVPPQVFSKIQKDGAESSSGDVPFTISILEPTSGGYFTYPVVSSVSLYIDGSLVGSPSAGTPGVWTDYTYTEIGLATGAHTWNASATNSATTSWNPNTIDDATLPLGSSGPGQRSFTIAMAADIEVSPSTTSVAPYDFGDVGVGADSTALTVTVTNVGGADLTLGTLGELLAPFSIASKTCDSNMVLSKDASCTISVIFSPTSTDEATATLSIPSNDTDEDVYLKGAGVSLPTATAASNAPELVSPADKATVSTVVTFAWKPYKGSDSYKLFYCKQNDFSGTGDGCTGKTIVEVASLKSNGANYYYAGTGFGLLLFGIVLTGGIRERRKIMLLFAALIISSGMLLASCGDDDKSTVNNGDAQRSAYKTYAVTGLDSGETYYWGVVAVDLNQQQVPSTRWSFTVE